MKPRRGQVVKGGASRTMPFDRPDPSATNPQTSFFERVYDLVEQIPKGRVTTYGQVASLLGVSRGARAVGWALRVLPASRQSTVPWHRVVGAGGRISSRAGSGPAEQRRRLRAEGVRFQRGRIDLQRHGLQQPKDSKETMEAPKGSGREDRRSLSNVVRQT